MPHTRANRRKRQSQLAFSPLPSSSPAKSSQPLATRDRAAAIVIASPNPHKRRKIEPHVPLPTPVASSWSSGVHDGGVPSQSSLLDQCQVRSYPKQGRKAILPAEFDDSESEDGLMLTPATQRRRARNITQPINDDGEDFDEDEDDVVPYGSMRRRPQMNRRVVGLDNEESEDDVPRSRRTQKAKLESEDSSSQAVADGESADGQDGKNSQELADLNEDLEFLGSSVPDTPRTLRHEDRSTKRQLNPRQLALEKLKQRRASQSAPKHGKKSIVIDDEDENSTASHESVEGGSIVEALDEVEEADEEDFVIDDEGDEEAEKVALPIKYSRYQTMRPKELFKYLVEWMVQKKLNPAFPIDDDIYRTAFNRLDDFVRGLGGSKFLSSAWTPAFTKSVKYRPMIEYFRMVNTPVLHDKCDACNRSGHPATYGVTFSGSPYDDQTLEDISDDEDDSRNIPPSDTTYNVGKFCMMNAKTAHALAHWKYHLNEWVIDYLKQEKYLTTEKIVERDNWSTKKRQKYANSIVDRMEADGEIKRLHRDFKNEVNTAQASNQGRYEAVSP